MNALQFHEHMRALGRIENYQKAILNKLQKMQVWLGITDEEELLKPVEVNVLASDENRDDKVKGDILRVLGEIKYNTDRLRV